jgi:hypothetical protein
MEINAKTTDIYFDEASSKAVADMLTDLISSNPAESYEGYEELSITNGKLEYIIKFQFIHEWNREERPYDAIIHQDICIQHLRIYNEEGNPIKYACKKDILDIIKDYFRF